MRFWLPVQTKPITCFCNWWRPFTKDFLIQSRNMHQKSVSTWSPLLGCSFLTLSLICTYLDVYTWKQHSGRNCRSTFVLENQYWQYICKKITSGICALRRLIEFFDQDTLLSVYNSIVQSYFNYCCDVWNVFGETQSKRLQTLYNRAAHMAGNQLKLKEEKLKLN